ncbi:MAG TPA: hypothetical protein VGM14_20955 [Streptosporangiaceae bacterium]
MANGAGQQRLPAARLPSARVTGSRALGQVAGGVWPGAVPELESSGDEPARDDSPALEQGTLSSEPPITPATSSLGPPRVSA